jgi:outer membrane protein TolC
MLHLRKANSIFTLLLLSFSIASKAQTRTDLESRLISSNQELQSLEQEILAQDSLRKSSYSTFLPSLNVIGGLAKVKTDKDDDKGQLGYLQGSANLFSGFKDRANFDIQAQKLELARLKYEIRVRSAKEELTEILTSMVGIHQLEKILDEEFEITQTQKQMAARKVSAGLTSQVDNYEFDLRQSEIEIQRRNIVREHDAIHQKLNALFGQEILDKELDNIKFATTGTISKDINLSSFENHPLVRKAKFEEQIADFEKTSATAEYLPRIDLNYSFGRLTPAEDNIKYNESEIALLITIPLFSGLDTYHKRKAAVGSLAAKEHEKYQVVLNIKSQFEQLKSRTKELVELYQIIDKKIIISEKYYNLTLAEYKRGIKNSPDLVGATERYFDTKKKKIEIQKELELVQVQLNNYK